MSFLEIPEWAKKDDEAWNKFLSSVPMPEVFFFFFAVFGGKALQEEAIE